VTSEIKRHCLISKLSVTYARAIFVLDEQQP
jgi:hypothetical protein